MAEGDVQQVGRLFQVPDELAGRTLNNLSSELDGFQREAPGIFGNGGLVCLHEFIASAIIYPRVHLSLVMEFHKVHTLN